MPVKGKIEKIYIACSKKDFYFAKLCIASIRYWDIDKPIELIIDEAWGKVDITYLEKYWGVKKYNSSYTIFKESYGKLEPLFEQEGKRILTLDADIILLGNIVKELENIDADFICQKLYLNEQDKDLNNWWFNIEKLKRWDKAYQYPGYVFYAGQLVTNEGIFSRDDFAEVLTFGNPPVLNQPEIFLQNADQGLLNYVVHKKAAPQNLSIADYEFFIGRYNLKKIKLLETKDIKSKKGISKMLHYHGPKNGLFVNLPGKSILTIYEKYFYRHYPSPFLQLLKERLSRTLKNPATYTIELGKEIFKRML